MAAPRQTHNSKTYRSDPIAFLAFRVLARRTLIATYFEPGERLTLYQLVGIEPAGDDVVRADAERFQMSSDAARKRDARFSLRVLPAYNFTCALTRYRMVSVEGKTAVDAAHNHHRNSRYSPGRIACTAAATSS